jgi:hypothetical protein
MESRFPNSRRMFVPFKDGRYSGGDAFLFDVAATKGNVQLSRSLTSARKNYLEQVRMFGYGYVLKFLLRRMTVHQAAEQGSKILNLNARVVSTRFAELGMDLDRPNQYEIIKADLEKRQSQFVTNPATS